jgi:hypothetical protein
VSARVPQPVVYTEGEMTLARALDMPTAQLRTVKRCPDCDAYIIPCDNSVWLDAGRAPADDVTAMGIGELGGMMIALGGAVDGSRHAIHEHQPDEEDE